MIVVLNASFNPNSNPNHRMSQSIIQWLHSIKEIPPVPNYDNKMNQFIRLTDLSCDLHHYILSFLDYSYSIDFHDFNRIDELGDCDNKNFSMIPYLQSRINHYSYMVSCRIINHYYQQFQHQFCIHQQYKYISVNYKYTLFARLFLEQEKQQSNSSTLLSEQQESIKVICSPNSPTSRQLSLCLNYSTCQSYRKKSEMFCIHCYYNKRQQMYLSNYCKSPAIPSTNAIFKQSSWLSSSNNYYYWDSESKQWNNFDNYIHFYQ